MLLVCFGMGGSCEKPNDPPQPPTITLVSVDNTDILPGDIVTIRFTTKLADSVLMFPGGVKVTLSDTTTHPVQLFEPTLIRLIAMNKAGFDTLVVNVAMSAATAEITAFSLQDNAVAIGDSTLLTWATSNADSIVVNRGVGKLASLSGSIYLKPSQTTTYRAIAYYVGTDTATATLTVEIPSSVVVANGLYYKGEMGSSFIDKPTQIFVRTTENALASKLWMQLELVEGDGTLGSDSMISGGSFSHNFSGAMGHAVIRAKVPGVDSTDVYLRANTLIPGPAGQGQYIRFDDNYAWVETYNGTPAAVVQDPRTNWEWLVYVDYEAALGVVFMVIDPLGNGQPDANDLLLGVIVNDKGPGYDKTTPEGIGIGSTYNDMVAAYGQPDTSFQDLTPPAADVYIYTLLGMTFFARPADSVIFEIHMIDPTPAGSAAKVLGWERAARPENSIGANKQSYRFHLNR